MYVFEKNLKNSFTNAKVLKNFLRIYQKKFVKKLHKNVVSIYVDAGLAPTYLAGI